MRLTPWHRLVVLVILGLVAASGVLWFVLHDLLGREPDGTLRALLVVHGVTSFVSAIVFGSVLPWHVWGGYLQRRNLFTGFGVTLALAVLIGSALLLYYGGDESREAARLVHLAVGFAFIAVMIAHAILGRRRRLSGNDEVSGSTVTPPGPSPLP